MTLRNGDIIELICFVTHTKYQFDQRRTLVRQGRSKPAKWVFHGNSTPTSTWCWMDSPDLSGWTNGTMGSRLEGVCDDLDVYPAKLRNTESQITLLADSACVWLFKVTFRIDATVMFTVLFNAVWVYCDILDPRVCTEVICFSKFSQP